MSSWLRRACIVLGLLQGPAYAQSEGGFMNGPLVASSPAGRSPEQGAFHLVGGIGVAAVDSLAQTTRFTSNLFALDFESALGNVGQVFSKRSIDEMIVQFVENLPTVLERDLYKTYKASSKKAVGSYFKDSKLDAKESAALFNFVLATDGRSPTEIAQLIKELKDATATMRQGGNKGSVQLGRELAASMKAAIAAAPKPAPVIGNPLNAKRRVAVSKAFLHSVVQTQGVPYARGTIEGHLETGRKAGLTVTGLSDSMIRGTMDNAFANLGLRECLANAMGNDAILACSKMFETNQNRMIGSALESLGPELRSGKLGVVYTSEQLGEKVNLGAHLGNAIRANIKDVKLLEQSGSSDALNRVMNAAASSVVKDVGGKVVSAKLAAHFSKSPESVARVQAFGDIVVDRFSKKLKLLKGGDDLAKQVQDLVGSGEGSLPDNKALDARLRGPFKDSLADPQVKAALLGIFLEKIPLTAEMRSELHGAYAEALSKKGPLSPSAKLPVGFRDFLKTFDGALAKVSNPAASQTTIAHLKNLIDPKSTDLNKIVASFAPGVAGISSFYMTCKPGEPYCDSVSEPYKQQMALLRDASSAASMSSFGEKCQASVPAIAEELFKGVSAMDSNIVKSPHDAVLALASERSQQSVDCLLAGLAAAKGLRPDETRRLHDVLSESRKNRLEERRDLVEKLHAYLGSPEAGGAAQGKLLATSEAVAENLVRDYATQHIKDFSEEPKKIATLFKSQANRDITDRLVARMLNNTDVIDENTSLPLIDYAKKIAEAPMKRGSPSDLAISKGLDKTLKDPETRRDILSLGLGIDNALLPRLHNGLFGPGLESRLRDAYANADLSGSVPKFASSVDPGVRSFLTDFDRSVQGIDSYRGHDESVLKFFSEAIKPESRVVDSIVAGANKGVRDLVMAMVSCKDGPTELCGGCLGDKGNWILVDQKKGTSEVLVSAPMGQLLNFLKVGLQPGADAVMNAECAAAIPATLERIAEQPSLSKAPLGVMKDISLFIDALARPENQTAFSCITAQLAENMFLSKLRVKHGGTEAAVRSLLSHVGVPSQTALSVLRGDTIFRTLERRNVNPEILERKADLVVALKSAFKKKDLASRHQLSLALQNLTRTSVVGGVTDPEMAFALANGSKLPAGLRAWAREGDTLARATLQCVEGHYREGFLPVALYAGEDVARQVSREMNPWVESGGEISVPIVSPVPIVDSPAPGDLAGTVEACVQSGSFITSTIEPEEIKALPPPAWVGGYKHTLKDFQDSSRAEGSATLNSDGEADVLAHTADYQTLINHLRSRQNVVGKGKGLSARAGDLVFEVQHTGPEAKRTLGHLKNVLDFPAAKILSALESYKNSSNDSTRKTLNDLISKNCVEVWGHWDDAKLKTKTLPESQRAH